MASKSGVDSYAKGIASLNIYFPESKICCNYCLLCRYEEAYKRYSCRATDEWLLNPFIGIGEQCVIKFKEETSER
jgi:hypothetical protein